jgi:hypothetical protein
MAVGDSGSWVIDKQHSQAYGYVTCSDAFGDAIVIPMRSALVNIASRLGAVRARLLWKSDISADEVNDGKCKNEGQVLQSAVSNRREVLMPGRQQETLPLPIGSLHLGATCDGGIAAKPCLDNALPTETVSPTTSISAKPAERVVIGAIMDNATLSRMQNATRPRHRIDRNRAQRVESIFQPPTQHLGAH